MKLLNILTSSAIAASMILSIGTVAFAEESDYTHGTIATETTQNTNETTEATEPSTEKTESTCESSEPATTESVPATSGTEPTTEAEETLPTEPVEYDLDSNGYFDVSDCTYLQQYIAGYFGDIVPENTDIDSSGFTDVNDVTRLQLILAGITDFDSIYPDVITLSRHELTLAVGESYTLSFTSDKDNFEYTYSSSNPNVSAVDKNGIISAKNTGEAVIRLSAANGVYDECKVTVKKAPSKITLSKSEMVLKVNGTSSVTAELNENAYSTHIEWTSSNSKVVEIEKLTESWVKLTAKGRGTATITAKTFNGKSASFKVYAMPDSYKISDVPMVNQDRLPTGCESCSASMLLQYYTYHVSEIRFVDNFLITRDLYYTEDNVYGPDPNSAFIGSPYNSYSFGAYGPVIAKSMNRYLSDKSYKAVYYEGKNLEYIAGKYIAQDSPVMVWATINMVESYKSMSWIVNYADENAKYPEGSVYTWTANEHCLVLTGYDSNYYYFNDPWTGERCRYEKSLVNKRYAELGKQIVVMEKK